MGAKPALACVAFDSPPSGTAVVFVDDTLTPGPRAKAFLAGAGDLLARAARTANFKGKALKTLEILAPAGLALDRLIVVGLGGDKDRASFDAAKLGGAVMGRIGTRAPSTHVLFEGPEGFPLSVADAGEFALGLTLRAYTFDRYKTKKKGANGEDEDEGDVAQTVHLASADPDAAGAAIAARAGTADAVMLARDLINEPPNVVYPESFAERTRALEALGVAVEILDEARLAELGFRALLGVGQGSVRESRVVLMRWQGAPDPGAAPLAFVGKGVCFDTGGISIKPAASMEDMKGDMAGAACVVGLMHALAARKARANVIGAIGLVENMPDGKAQRPGDIVTALSGKTIEIINTDAEGRLVLADVLWHVQEIAKPAFIIDLATLTGAIVVALGKEHAGLFATDDTLADRLLAAGKATGERLWRMPLDKAYDKQIDSKFADVKNTGGRDGGSITAAQFLKRFVKDETAWAHIDIAGVAIGSPESETNRGWSAGFGVRLLDRLVADHYEG